MSLDRLLAHVEIAVQPFSLCILSGGWRLRLPQPTGPLLHFVLKGRGKIVGPDRQAHHLEPLSLAIVPQGAAHALESHAPVRHEKAFDLENAGPPLYRIVAGSEDQADLTIACGMISAKFGESLGLFNHLSGVLVVPLADLAPVRELFAAILEEQAQPKEGSNALTGACMTAVMVYFLRRVGKGDTDALPWLRALQDPRLGRAVDAMLLDCGRPWSLETLADVAGMSRSAFAERFTKAFGNTPMAFLHELRMNLAARLLNDRNLTMDAVAKRVGFSSRSHFSQAFSHHHGISPAAARNPAG
ncbi:MAG: helix-turn-helix transcriptional regulator [Opitutae bacterium]|nr:helix-turn-helix transcriptional regulator [Opitutae bacterium]